MEKLDLLATLTSIIINIFICYSLLGLFTLIVVEAISTFFKLRSKFLRSMMIKNFGDEKIVDCIFNHPLIKLIGKNPQYIDPKLFSYALLDCLQVKRLYEFMDTAKAQQNSYYKNNFVKALYALSFNSTTVEDLSINARFLFTDFVYKISDGYRNIVQRNLIIVSTALVLVINIDTIKLFDSISNNKLAKTVQSIVKEDPEIKEDTKKKLSSDLSPEAYPLGWREGTVQEITRDFTTCLLTLLGWFFSIVFTSFTAQFIYSRYIGRQKRRSIENKE